MTIDSKFKVKINRAIIGLRKDESETDNTERKRIIRRDIGLLQKVLDGEIDIPEERNKAMEIKRVHLVKTIQELEDALALLKEKQQEIKLIEQILKETQNKESDIAKLIKDKTVSDEEVLEALYLFFTNRQDGSGNIIPPSEDDFKVADSLKELIIELRPQVINYFEHYFLEKHLENCPTCRSLKDKQE
ncbi:hypothetical protein ACFLY5_01115 [Patescibacteria group bacterium]